MLQAFLLLVKMSGRIGWKEGRKLTGLKYVTLNGQKFVHHGSADAEGSNARVYYFQGDSIDGNVDEKLVMKVCPQNRQSNAAYRDMLLITNTTNELWKKTFPKLLDVTIDEDLEKELEEDDLIWWFESFTGYSLVDWCSRNPRKLQQHFDSIVDRIKELHKEMAQTKLWVSDFHVGNITWNGSTDTINLIDPDFVSTVTELDVQLQIADMVDSLSRLLPRMENVQLSQEVMREKFPDQAVVLDGEVISNVEKASDEPKTKKKKLKHSKKSVKPTPLVHVTPPSPEPRIEYLSKDQIREILLYAEQRWDTLPGCVRHVDGMDVGGICQKISVVSYEEKLQCLLNAKDYDSAVKSLTELGVWYNHFGYKLEQFKLCFDEWMFAVLHTCDLPEESKQSLIEMWWNDRRVRPDKFDAKSHAKTVMAYIRRGKLLMWLNPVELGTFQYYLLLGRDQKDRLWSSIQRHILVEPFTFVEILGSPLPRTHVLQDDAIERSLGQ